VIAGAEALKEEFNDLWLKAPFLGGDGWREICVCFSQALRIHRTIANKEDDWGSRQQTKNSIIFFEKEIRCADIFANSLRIHENFKNLELFLGTPKIYYTCKSFEQVHSPHPLQSEGGCFS